MGIKHFFIWFKNNFKNDIFNLKQTQKLNDIEINVDNLMIDMNGIFHNSAQKIYEYGNYKPLTRMLNNKIPIRKKNTNLQLKVFENVCKTVENLFNIVEPKKKLILCVDGPAPQSKQCIASGTYISMSNGTSCLIEDIIEGDKVWGWNGNGYTATSNLGLQVKGKKDTIKLILIDGRSLICTPDHRILIMSKGQCLWKEAEKLKIGDNIICGVNNPLDVIGKDEKDWFIDLGDIQLNMKKFRKEILILARLIGYILSNGYIISTKKSVSCGLILSTKIDAMLCAEEIKQLSGKYPCINKSYRDKYIIYTVALPQKWAMRISKLKGMPIGKRIIQPITIPEFLLNNKCPLSIIREFIGGLFGGNDYCPSLIINDDNYSFTSIEFSQVIIEKHKESFIEYMNQINIFLNKLGVSGGIIYGPYQDNYKDIISKDNQEKKCLRYTIKLPLNNDFIENIGFRYVHNKSLRLSIVSSYLNFCKTNKIQEEKIETNEFIKTNKKQISSIDILKFLKITNTESWFELYSHPYEQECIELPSYLCPIINIKQNEKKIVYDIEVNDNHSFLANGLCVHNCQQRQRRFRAAFEKNENELELFDSNSITPGTKFMDHLTKYIDWYIRKRICEDIRWQNIEVIFSNEKVPGEGEAKCISYIRKYGNKNESYCIHGLDADLIMLAMGTHFPNFYILREDLYDYSNDFFCIKINNVRNRLAELMYWECEKHNFDPETAVNDFIFICFMVGNDFLPHVPSLEIIEKGIDIMIKVYKQTGTIDGHLTHIIDNNIIFIPSTLKIFLNIISSYEKNILEDKLSRKSSFFPDPLLNKCSMQNKDKYEVDIEKYRREYCFTFFPNDVNIEEICHKYLEGMQWVLSYYTRGVPNWKWQFPYHYAPPASVLVDNIKSFTFPIYGKTTPATPFQQLLCVLPPKSANLIPYPLNTLLTNENSPLKAICPDNFEIDLSGKRKEWEGIVILPMVDFLVVKEAYNTKINEVNQVDIKRNIFGKTFVYIYTSNSSSIFKSYYGDIEKCKVNTVMIDL